MTPEAIKRLQAIAAEVMKADADRLDDRIAGLEAENARLRAELASYHCTCGHSLLTGHHEDDCPHRTDPCHGCFRAPTKAEPTYDEECTGCRRFYGDQYATEKETEE